MKGERMRGRRRGRAGVKYGGRMSEGVRMRGRRRRGRARVKYIGRMSEGGENEREAERESRSKIWRKDE